MITRRGFLQSILALSAAPAIVKAESLMRIVKPSIIVPSHLVAQPNGQYISYLFGHNGQFDIQTFVGQGQAFAPVVTHSWEPEFLMFKRYDAPSDWVVIRAGKESTIEEAQRVILPRYPAGTDGNIIVRRNG